MEAPTRSVTLAGSHRIEPSGPPAPGRPIVGWRSWFVVPDPTPGEEGRPLLHGLFAFPWRTKALDAKCLWQDRVAGPVVGTATLDRYHPVVPDPGCTCGIYAAAGPQFPPPAIRRAARPVASGFVELSGRTLTGPAGWRTQRATIIGPLTLSFPVPRWAALAQRLSSRPAEEPWVVEEPGVFRVVWAGLRHAVPAGEWAAGTAPALGQRYGVEVVWTY